MALFNGEGMIGRLKLDQRPFSAIPRVQVSLEIEGRWVNRNVVAEPTKLRWFILNDRGLPPTENPGEPCFRYRNPQAPKKAIVLANKRDFETAPNKDILVIDE